LYEPRSRAPEAPPQPVDLRPRVRLDGELRAAALARRGRARQGLAPRHDAGRQLATVRQSSRPLRVHVDAPWQEAPLHGRRDRAAARVAPRPEPRLAFARRGPLPPRAPAAGARPQPTLPTRARAPRTRRRPRRVRVDRLCRLGTER